MFRGKHAGEADGQYVTVCRKRDTQGLDYCERVGSQNLEPIYIENKRRMEWSVLRNRVMPKCLWEIGRDGCRQCVVVVQILGDTDGEVDQQTPIESYILHEAGAMQV